MEVSRKEIRIKAEINLDHFEYTVDTGTFDIPYHAADGHEAAACETKCGGFGLCDDCKIAADGPDAWCCTKSSK